MPDISVVVPTFNRAATLGRAIRSVLDDSFPGLELIVVDDASTDITDRLIAEIDDSRLRYVRLPEKANGNVARNRGINLAASPLVAFLDSDDAFLPGRAERLVRFFASHPRVEVTLDEFAVVTGTKKAMAAQPHGSFPPARLADLLLCHALPLTCSAIAARRSVLMEAGGFDPDLRRQQDRDLLLRLCASHRVALGTGSDVVKYQQRDSISRQSAGYVASLDALLGRHASALRERHRDVVGYLAARNVLREIFHGRILAAMGELRALSPAERKHLPEGFLRSVMRYPRGKRLRREMSRQALAPGEATSISESPDLRRASVS